MDTDPEPTPSPPRSRADRRLLTIVGRALRAICHEDVRNERELNRARERLRRRRARDAESNSYGDDAHFFEYAVNFKTTQKNSELKPRNLCHRHWFEVHIQEDRDFVLFVMNFR
ncbi:hypothetical protein EVAR_46997_1 [Eumeta japonica]|uniref:Uncharacterized protein n=1 Tax=Eumeta variegata TaxID=151549 RepID=A0A4C1X9B1_EUMVA|nr:hypothetical protein EVAR_46997_1 [Eumeta japonica]